MYYFKQPKYTSPHTYAWSYTLNHTRFPTQQWLFLLPQTNNCHSEQLAISNRFFFSWKSFPLLENLKSNNTVFRTPTRPRTISIACVQTRNSCVFSSLADLTSVTLALSSFRANVYPAKSPCDGSRHKVVLCCMRRAHFLMPPLALLNHLVRGAQTMPCVALKGHYNIALSTFTATKLNGPHLRGRIKQSTALMSYRPQIWSDSVGRFGTTRHCLRTARVQIKFYHCIIHLLIVLLKVLCHTCAKVP